MSIHMSMTDFIAILALIISASALALQVKQWFDSGPKIKLSIMGDAVQFPNDDGNPKLALTVTNRGNAPTQITHMIAFTFDSKIKKLRRKPQTTGIVNSPLLPMVLEPKRYWIGMMNYDAKTTAARQEGRLYVGIYATHSDREYLMKVPPAKDDLRKGQPVKVS